ncbi:MAG TPA: alpha/beta hydrolase [Chthoniobacterales bacterium]|nr:alpha/beta hydrolase [Chthoniobacterales bacterium]
MLTLDLAVPATPSKPPLVIYIHGGAWSGGDTKEVRSFSWLTGSGFALASISYRFSKDAVYPAQIEDCKAAVRWLRAHAREYGYDATRIGVIGTSAGAHLAVLLGTTGGNKELEGSVGGNLDQSSKVQAVVDFYGPTDFILRAKTQPEMTDVPGSRVYNLLGGAPKDHEALAKLASGAWQVTPDDAPLLIFHGSADNQVFPGQSERLYAAAKAAGLDASLHIVPGATHAIDPFLTGENKQLVIQFLKKYLTGR